MERTDDPTSRWMNRTCSLLMLSLALTSCSPKADQRPAPVTVRTARPSSDVFVDSLDTVSTLEAVNEVELAAQAGGRVQRILVRAGDPVQQGQLLVVLDQTQLRADVAALQAEAERDQLSYERYRTLVSQGAATAQERDEYKASAIGSREALRARQADLAYKEVRAPIAGVVGNLSVKNGDVLQAGVPFGRIIRNSQLQARIDVPANRVNRLRPGQLVQLLSGSGQRPVAEGRLRSLDPDVASSSQTLLATASVSNSDGQLRNGQRLRTRVILGAQRQLSVPFSAVKQQFGQAFVVVVGSLEQLRRDPGRVNLQTLAKLPASTRVALQRPVQLGPLQGDHYPVLGGLEADERLVLSGGLGLRHGTPVREEPN